MKNILSNKIKVLRAEKGITQEELGLSCGLSRQSINAIETGKYVPTVVTALKIAKYFKRNIEEIFTLNE
jgi:putative transcriptional regulator